MSPFRGNKVLGPGHWFGEHEEGSFAPQIFFAPKPFNPFPFLQKGSSAYAHPLIKNLFTEYNFPIFRGQYFFGEPGAGKPGDGIFLPLTIDAREINGKLKRLSHTEESRAGGHYRPFQGASL
jgi:hypothetical protein